LQDGQPRPLFLRGAAPSIETLVRRIQPGLVSQPSWHTCSQLAPCAALAGDTCHVRAPSFIADRLDPRTRVVCASCSGCYATSSTTPARDAPARAGRSSPRIARISPCALRAAFDIRAKKEALEMTWQKDAEMRRAENSRRPRRADGASFFRCLCVRGWTCEKQIADSANALPQAEPPGFSGALKLLQGSERAAPDLLGVRVPNLQTSHDCLSRSNWATSCGTWIPVHARA